MSALLENLICFVGARDPRPSFAVTGPTGDTQDGPVMSLLNHRSFDEVYLLCSSGIFFERGTQIKLECEEIEGMPKVSLMPVDIPDVINYTGIYTTLLQAVTTVQKRFDHRPANWWVLLDPGTPQMQTAWILLVRSGAFNAGLIQGVPPEFNNGLYTCREVNLSDKALPVILPAGETAGETAGESTAAELSPAFSAGKPVTTRGKPEKAAVFGEEDFDRALVQSGLAVRDELTRQLFRQAWMVAQHDHYHHLILGETGTGKTELAKWIHKCGPRKNKPFQSLNCATLTGSTAASTLFGHKKGAYTGADADRPGFLRSADGGVLFLDEIGELSLENQAKLLHVLDEGSFYPMGSDKLVHVDVVIIAATNKDLKVMEEKGDFRQDLYSRLSTFPLTMPALRNRPNDLNFIIDSTLEKWNSDNKAKKTISDEARSILQACNWPKNIRELQQTIHRVCLLNPAEQIGPEDLPMEILESAGKDYKSRIPSVLLPENGVRLRELILDIEKEYFRQAIERSGGIMSRAASLVGWEGPAFRKAVKERYPELLNNG